MPDFRISRDDASYNEEFDEQGSYAIKKVRSTDFSSISFPSPPT
jgi:hypothetical protein